MAGVAWWVHGMVHGAVPYRDMGAYTVYMGAYTVYMGVYTGKYR